MNLKDLLVHSHIECVIKKNVMISNLHYDSRHIKKNGLFVALSGLHVNGHQFIEQAKKNGACAVVVEEHYEDPDLIVILVKNSRKVLAQLCHTFYNNPTANIPVIGITGTNGKTTITYILEAILKTAGFNPGVIGTVNYRVGDHV